MDYIITLGNINARVGVKVVGSHFNEKPTNRLIWKGFDSGFSNIFTVLGYGD
jgi:hypothetical protein